MQYRAVLFDLDGTLLNTLDDLADSMNAALRRLGFPLHPTSAYKRFVGGGLDNTARLALPASSRDEGTVARCLDEMRREYSARWANKTVPYEGIPELLDELVRRGVRMAVLSNKPDEFTQLCVGKLLAGWRFDAVVGVGPSVPIKPDPAGALLVSRALGIPPGQFLHLGDSDTDMLTARAAGMYAVGALWGFRTADELRRSGAAVLIGYPTELLELLA